jgi:hypothetical protein
MSAKNSLGAWELLVLYCPAVKTVPDKKDPQGHAGLKAVNRSIVDRTEVPWLAGTWANLYDSFYGSVTTQYPEVVSVTAAFGSVRLPLESTARGASWVTKPLPVSSEL